MGAHGCGSGFRSLVSGHWSGVLLSAVSCPTDLRQVICVRRSAICSVDVGPPPACNHPHFLPGSRFWEDPDLPQKPSQNWHQTKPPKPVNINLIWEPKRLPNRPKTDLKSSLDLFFLQKRDFSKSNPRSRESTKMTPRRSPKRPKIDPRRLQDDLQELLFSTSFSTSILVRLGSDFCLILAPPEAPKCRRPAGTNGSKMTLDDP